MEGSGVASASRSLFTPRTRLPAELGFLVGASQKQVDACLAGLWAGIEPDTQSLSGLARMNVLAHLIGTGNPSDSRIRDFIALQEAAPKTIKALILAEHRASGVPPAQDEAIDAGLRELMIQHADALASAMVKRKDGAQFLSDLIRSCDSALSERAIFLRQCAGSWERHVEGKNSRILEQAEDLEKFLFSNATPDLAERLADLIKRFAADTAPPREAARLLGLPHEASDERQRHWQTTALHVNDRLDAPMEAAIILEAIDDGFRDQSHLGARIRANLAICRERQTAGDGTPALKRLANAIEKAIQSPDIFENVVIIDGWITSGSPAPVIELRDSFTAATKEATTDRPWQLLRSLALELHNTHSYLDAAWALTLLALDTAKGVQAAEELATSLEADKGVLRSNILQRDLNAAVRNKQSAAIRKALAELIAITSEPNVKGKYIVWLRKMRRNLLASYLRWGFWAAVVGGIAIASLNNRTTTSPSNHSFSTGSPTLPSGSIASTSPPNPHTQPTQSAPQQTVQAPSSAAQIETQPSVGSILSRNELRWCKFHVVRADAGKAYLEERRADWNADAASFNSTVLAYNSAIYAMNKSCGNYQYYEADAAAVDAELGTMRERLVQEGRAAMEIVYKAGLPPRPVPIAPAYQTAPTYRGEPQYTKAVPQLPLAYQEGQADRRAWEAWISTLGEAERSGADWWASVRSSPHPPACSSATDKGDMSRAMAGCAEAKSRLTQSDRRRRLEPNYKLGWNNP